MGVNAESLAWKKQYLAGTVLPSNVEPIEPAAIAPRLLAGGPLLGRQWVMEPLVTVLVGSASWARLGLAWRRSCDGESGTGLIILLRRKAGHSVGAVRGDGSRSAESNHREPLNVH